MQPISYVYSGICICITDDKGIENGTHLPESRGESLHMPKRQREQRGETIAVALPQKSNSNSDSLQPGNEIQTSESKGRPGVDKGCGSGRTPGPAAKKNAENLERCTIVMSCAPTVITRTPMTIMKVLLPDTQKNL